MCGVTELSSSSRLTLTGGRACELLSTSSGLCRIFLEDGIQSFQEKIRIGFGENERRPQLDDIMMRPVRTGENAALAKPIHYIRCLQRRCHARFAVQHQIDSQE